MSYMKWLCLLLLAGCAPDPMDRLADVLEGNTNQINQMVLLIECAQDYSEPEARWYACEHLMLPPLTPTTDEEK